MTVRAGQLIRHRGGDPFTLYMPIESRQMLAPENAGGYIFRQWRTWEWWPHHIRVTWVKESWLEKHELLSDCPETVPNQGEPSDGE